MNYIQIFGLSMLILSLVRILKDLDHPFSLMLIAHSHSS